MHMGHVVTMTFDAAGELVALENHPVADPAPAGEPVAVGGGTFPGVLAGAQPAGEFRPLRNLIRRRLIERAQEVYPDRPRAAIAEAVDAALLQEQVDTGRPILDWLRNGGFEQIFNLIILILKAIA